MIQILLLLLLSLFLIIMLYYYYIVIIKFLSLCYHNLLIIYETFSTVDNNI